MIQTTSYKSPGMAELITSLVKTVNPKKVIEFGTQRGHSAILLAKGTKGTVYTYDNFSKTYSEPPFKETHADLLQARENVKGYNIKIRVKDVSKVKPVDCDILHIDICNHYGNVQPLLKSWKTKVKKMILLEGGIYNKWQKKYGFKSFTPALLSMTGWNYCVIKGEDGYAVTILTRK